MATPTTRRALTPTEKNFMDAIHRRDWMEAEYILRESPNMDVNIFMNIQGVNELQSSPLQFAAQNGQTALVQALIARGADVNYQNKTGQTPLMYATRGGHLDAMKAIVEAGADYNMPTSNTRTFDNTALHYAAVHGHSDAVRYLASLPNANKNHVNLAGNTPYDDALTHMTQYTYHGNRMLAAQMTRMGFLSREEVAMQYQLINAVRKGDIQQVQTQIKNLQDAHLDLNGADGFGFTALHYAAISNNPDITKALLEAGANPNIQNKDGKTASDLARTALTLDEENTTNPNTEEIRRIRTQQVDILDFTEQAHTNAERAVDHQRTVSIQGRRSVHISKDTQQEALTSLRSLESSGALKPDENGQSNAEIYLQRLIFVNQLEGRNSPARKALDALFNRDGSVNKNLSPEDIQAIQAGIEYSIQHSTTMGTRTVMGHGNDYMATTETREVPTSSDNQLNSTPNLSNQSQQGPNLASTLSGNAQDITNIDTNGQRNMHSDLSLRAGR